MYYNPPETIKTDDYSIFVEYEFNRDFYKLEGLRQSMKQYGFDEGCSLHCRRRDDGKLQIVQGHHRFAVAKELGLPVSAIISQYATPIEELELQNRHWTIRDFAKGHCRRGNPEYEEVLKFATEFRLPIQMSAVLLGGAMSEGGSSNLLAWSFKRGDFTVNALAFARQVGELTEHARKCGLSMAKHRLFVNVLTKCCKLQEFDIGRWRKKLEAHCQLMERQPTMEKYHENVELIYNRQCKEKDKVALKWLLEHRVNG